MCRILLEVPFFVVEVVGSFATLLLLLVLAAAAAAALLSVVRFAAAAAVVLLSVVWFAAAAAAVAAVFLRPACRDCGWPLFDVAALDWQLGCAELLRNLGRHFLADFFRFSSAVPAGLVMFIVLARFAAVVFAIFFTAVVWLLAFAFAAG